MVGVRRRLLLLLSLGVLAGCSDGARVSTPAGYTTRTVRDPSFSIALPRNWPSFDPRSKHRDSPLTLIAVAPGRAGTFRTSLIYVLTYTTAPTAAARYAKIFDVSAHTFQLR
jgi:hypothetical protein